VKRGVFEECSGEGDQKVFRLRWGEDRCTLTASEICHAQFIRYLVQRGRMGESLEREGGLALQP